MRRFNTKVFDDWVLTATPAFTREDHDLFLGQFDSLALFVVVDNADNTGNVNVQVQHSGDGRSWIERSKHSTGGGAAASNEISNKPIIAATQAAFWGFDANSLPSLRFVRLKISFTGAMTKAHVRLFVTARDRAHIGHGHAQARGRGHATGHGPAVGQTIKLKF